MFFALTFAILTVCCSMTSWIAVRSLSSILSNSSIQQIPLSARTSAPPSKIISPVSVSRWIDAVKPTPLLPRPVVYTPLRRFKSLESKNVNFNESKESDLGATVTMCFKSWDFATPGSPMRQTWISPRILIPSSSLLATPPQSNKSNAFLTSSCPNISGEIDCASLPYISGCFRYLWSVFIISLEAHASKLLNLLCVTDIASTKVFATSPALIAWEKHGAFFRSAGSPPVCQTVIAQTKVFIVPWNR